MSNLVGRISAPTSKELALQLLNRLRTTSNLEKRIAAAKITLKVAEVCRGIDELYKQVCIFINKTLEIIKEILEDPSVEVRTTLLSNLPKIISYSKPQNEKLIRSILTLCLEKGPDFIRAQTVTSILSLAEVEKASAIALLKTAASLSDWRVRYAVCSSMNVIVDILGPGVFSSFLMANISDYLLDQNPDTRIAAMETFPVICKVADPELISTKIVNCLNHIVNDTEVTVKIALATYMPYLVVKLGKKKCSEIFLPLILSLLRDEAMDVKASMIENFYPIFEVVGPVVLLDALEPAFLDLSKCVLWRHKRTCLIFLCSVAQAGGREALRPSLVKVLIDLLKDDFESVREEVIETIKKLRETLKDDWILENIIPEIER